MRTSSRPSTTHSPSLRTDSWASRTPGPFRKTAEKTSWASSARAMKSRDLKIDATVHPPLVELEPGQKGRVARVSDSDPAMLRYLGELGIYPEAGVELLEREPFGGPFRIRIDGREHRIGEELARNVFVSLGGNAS